MRESSEYPWGWGWRQTLSWKVGFRRAKAGRGYSCPWWADERAYGLAFMQGRGVEIPKRPNAVRYDRHHRDEEIFVDIRFTPIPTAFVQPQQMTRWANFGLMHRSYSITSSARSSTVRGTEIPRALAVFRLMTSSYLVGACTGRSAGFSPLRMRSTYSAARLCMSLALGP